ncbi:MAG TPA: Holliday junction resolvase RuvX [Clostridia bacterium]|jgi:putative Holliday junction resolvase|nr:Holliday junction resolvase RuvX [Clostridia bacterium]NLV33268.1 Holliday junction resolvase RuvX [Clostridiaceae bacterium]MDD4501592.1 Holliday junction resolvase RuvX [Clostridia bacterium]HPB16224.1 Holliday junction resolvase RuvX [Clostridia bacterium]HQM96145.1 Holliday junction resolvase RuvX [Clostridia bacterium]
MIIIAIDYGEKRIGVAKSDPLGLLAQGVTTIEWNKDINKPLDIIEKIVTEYGAASIVIGLPLNMDDSEGEKALKVRNFASMLEERCKKPIILYDERLSTVEAHDIIHMQGKKTGKDKKRIDMVAACVILQSYLDNMDNKKKDKGEHSNGR